MMRRLTLLLLLSGALVGSASAADLKVRKPVYKAPPPAPVASNISVYAGTHLGFGWSEFSSSASLGGVQSIRTNGYLGGTTIGMNYQVNKFVFGLEGDFSLASVQGNSTGTIGGAPLTAGVRNLWFATAAGRLGYAYDRMLFYAKGGAAWTQYKFDFDAPTVGGASSKQVRTGWMVGAGLEQAVTDAISAKVEYNYLDFGTRSETLTATGGFVLAPADVRLNAHLVKLGLNYRFNTGR